MSEIRFHSTVMTPNGEGVVQGLLTQSGKESILVSHDPKELNPEEVYGEPLLPGKQQSIWVLYAYAPGAVKLIERGKK